MAPTSISECERLEQEALAALKAEFPDAQIITPGCDRRYAVSLTHPAPYPAYDYVGQWWEYDTLPAVRQRIVWALANR